MAADSEGWARGLVLSVSGVPHAERAAIHVLVERAGGRYSPNLSRRCTHLAVPGGAQAAAGAGGGGSSEKLRIAWRNRHKWGLEIVDLRWLLECAQAQRWLDEAAFPVPPPPAAPNASKEQAAPNTASSDRPTASKGSSWAGESSMLAADTYWGEGLGQGPLPPTTLVAGAARAARAPDPLRQSVNSRPLSSFGGQAAASLQTQAPSAKRSGQRSVHWQGSEGSSVQAGAAAAAAHAAAAAVLPAELERQHWAAQQEDEEEEIDFSKLPMTQAGFIPAADLLEQLRASTAGLPPPAASGQQEQQLCSGQRAGSVSPQPVRLQEARKMQLLQQQQQPVQETVNMQIDAQLPGGGLPVAPVAAQQQRGAASTADLLAQLRQSASGASPAQQRSTAKQQQRSPGLSTADLLRQIHQSRPAAVQVARPPKQQQLQSPGLPTADLLAQLQQAAPAAGAAPVARQQEQQQRSRDLPTAELLAQLQQAAPAAPAPAASLQERQPMVSTAELLQQLRASAYGLPASRPPEQQKQQQRAGLATADLLQQLQAPASLPAAADQQQRRQQAPLTADLLEQLRASMGDAGVLEGAAPAVPAGAVGQVPPAAAAAAAEGEGDLDAMLQRLQQLPLAASPNPIAAAVAGTLGPRPALPQQQDSPAAAALPHVQSEAAVAAASQLAAQLRGLLSEGQPAATAAVAAGGSAGGGRSTEELLMLLRQQQQQQPSLHQRQQEAQPATGWGHESPAVPAQLAAPAAGPAEPRAAAGGADGGVDALLQKLRGLAQQQSLTPLRQQQQQVQQVVQHAQQPMQLVGAALEEQELPPAKYRRQTSPYTSVPPLVAPTAAPVAPPSGGQLLQQAPAAAAPPATPAVDAAPTAGSGGSLAPTAVVSGGSDVRTSASGTPASSAGSPSQAKPADAPAVAAPSPAGSGSGELSSQVSESGGRVFGGMLALVDPDLPAEEHQRVRAALEQGGGQLADGGSLCRGVTLVVCQPEAALRWLSMGVGIVSPTWVIHSLRSGRQQRCLSVSADASRHLPSAGPATSAACGRGHTQAGSQSGSGGSGTQSQQPLLPNELLVSKEARQQMLCQLAGGNSGSATAAALCGASGGSGGGAAAHQQAVTPAELLADVLWSVLDPPAAACAEGQRLQRAADPGELVIPDSEDEEEEETEAALFCITASQAVVDGVLQEAQGTGPPATAAGGTPDAAAAAWQEAVALRGPAQLTLLLPRDARGDLGLDTRCVVLPCGGQGRRELRVGQLLAAIHGYYAEQLQPQAQLELLQSFPAAEAVAAVLRPAFLELAPLARGALLGPRVSLDGLRKATREPGGAVYEVLLRC